MDTLQDITKIIDLLKSNQIGNIDELQNVILFNKTKTNKLNDFIKNKYENNSEYREKVKTYSKLFMKNKYDNNAEYRERKLLYARSYALKKKDEKLRIVSEKIGETVDV